MTIESESTDINKFNSGKFGVGHYFCNPNLFNVFSGSFYGGREVNSPKTKIR